MKIGDKVQIVKFPNPDRIGLVCEVTGVKAGWSRFAYMVKSTTIPWDCLVFQDEIRKLPERGRQLLFSFMDE